MDINNNKKRKICLTNDNNKEGEGEVRKLLKKRRKIEKERYTSLKKIEECKIIETILNKQIYDICEHNWIAEDRQMYEKRWYQCDKCGLYRNQYMNR